MAIHHRLSWARQDSNLRPSGYEPPALTAELQAQMRRGMRHIHTAPRLRALRPLPHPPSGRRDSNPRITAWKAVALPLGDARGSSFIIRASEGRVKMRARPDASKCCRSRVVFRAQPAKPHPAGRVERLARRGGMGGVRLKREYFYIFCVHPRGPDARERSTPWPRDRRGPALETCPVWGRGQGDRQSPAAGWVLQTQGVQM